MVELTPAEQKFILHWGEMGSKWGINRTVAQIHALLMISPQPLNAEDISNTLSIARSNVSTSIKELIGWEIVKPVHVLGDRREHYETLHDVWEKFRIIAEKRKRREIDPTIHALKECLAEMDGKPGENPYTKERLQDLLDFMDTMATLFEQFNKLPTPTLAKICTLKTKLVDMLTSVVKK